MECRDISETLGKAVKMEVLGYHPLHKPRKTWKHCMEDLASLGMEWTEAINEDSI